MPFSDVEPVDSRQSSTQGHQEMYQRDSIGEPSLGPSTPGGDAADHETTCVDHPHLDYPTPQMSDAVASPSRSSPAGNSDGETGIEAAPTDIATTPPAMPGSNEPESEDEDEIDDDSEDTFADPEIQASKPKPRRGPLPCAENFYTLSRPSPDDIIPALRSDDWSEVTSFPSLESLLLPDEWTYYRDPFQGIPLPAFEPNSVSPPPPLEVARQRALLAAFLMPRLELQDKSQVDRYWDLFMEFWVETRRIMTFWRVERLDMLRVMPQVAQQVHDLVSYEARRRMCYLPLNGIEAAMERENIKAHKDLGERWLDWMDILLRAHGTRPFDDFVI